MSDPIAIPGAMSKSEEIMEPVASANLSPPDLTKTQSNDSASSLYGTTPPGARTPGFFPSNPSSPLLSPLLSRRPSFTGSGSGSYQEDWEAFPPIERLTIFDVFDNLALRERVEKFQLTINSQKEKLRRQRERIAKGGSNVRNKVVDEWRRRLPPPEEQLDRYRQRMSVSVERLGKRWNEQKVVSTREKISFICGVMNVFISGYIIGTHPLWMIHWYTLQLCYFMPIRYYTYHKRGYHYFLADLCYFVNALMILSIWAFPNSKRLFISTYCLAFGNNAWAIAMWRNSLVFHSFDKVTRYVQYSPYIHHN
jgi:Protein of unknown function (DUF2838)